MSLPIFTNNQSTVSRTVNTSRWIKYTFLSFTQAVFYNYDEFKWDPLRSNTKIIIQDKFAKNNINPEKTPQIIFNRGSYRWVRMTTDSTQFYEAPELDERKRQRDLMRSSASFSCIAADATTSEHIADTLWLALYSYRELLKKHGIHYILSADLGECSPIKLELANTTVELFNTPVYITFDYQISYTKNVNYGGYIYSLLPPTGYEGYIYVPANTDLPNFHTTVNGVWNSDTQDYIPFGSGVYNVYTRETDILGSGLYHPYTNKYFSLVSNSEYDDIIISGIIAGFNLGNPGIIDMFGIVISGFPESDSYELIYEIL